MRRLLLLFLPLFAAVVAGSIVVEPQTAFACTTDPTYNPLRGADAVVYGHVDRIAHDWDRPEAPYDPSILTIAVERTLQGGAFPEFIEAHADVPLPDSQVMCPQLDRSKLIGRSGVFVLYHGADGSWSTNRMVVWFTDEPRETVPGETLARLLDGTNADAPYHPSASLAHSSTACNLPFEVQGGGWPANTFIDIRIDGEHGVFGRSAPDGSFVIPVPRATLPCPRDGQFTVSVQAPAFLDLQPVSFPARIGSTSPLPPGTGTGTTPTGPSTREIILIAGAGSLLIGIVLLAAIAAMSQPETPARRR